MNTSGLGTFRNVGYLLECGVPFGIRWGSFYKYSAKSLSVESSYCISPSKIKPEVLDYSRVSQSKGHGYAIASAWFYPIKNWPINYFLPNFLPSGWKFGRKFGKLLLHALRCLLLKNWLQDTIPRAKKFKTLSLSSSLMARGEEFIFNFNRDVLTLESLDLAAGWK